MRSLRKKQTCDFFEFQVQAKNAQFGHILMALEYSIGIINGKLTEGCTLVQGTSRYLSVKNSIRGIFL